MKPIVLRSLRASLFFLPAFIVAGCGDDGGEGGKGGAATGAGSTASVTSSAASTVSASTAIVSASSSSGGGAPDVSGTWSSACIASPQADGSTQHISLHFEIGATDWAVEYVIHADDACTQPFVTLHIDGPYQLTAPSAVASGAWEATFSFDHKTVTPGSDAAVGFLSSLPDCGTGAFAEGSPTDVLADGCAALGQYPGDACPADFDLVLREADSLRFGERPADNDLCSTDHRPTALSSIILASP